MLSQSLLAEEPGCQAFAAFDRRLDPTRSAPLAVALSGGGDSLALLALACDWAARCGRKVVALTVDHRLQAESRAWTEQAATMAGRLGAGWRGLAWTGPKPATGLPAAARAARHALIADAAREAGAAVVLFAHTRDDVEEGEVMRAAGSSLGRLFEWAPSPAWPEGRGVFLLRPLLDTSRADLRTLLRARSLDWIEDPANADMRYARARARSSLSAHPRVGVDPERSVQSSEAPARIVALADLTEVDQTGVLGLRRDRLRGAPHAFLAAALVCAAGGATPPRGERVARLADRIDGPDTFVTTLAGARVEIDADAVRIFRDAGEITRGGLAPIRVEPGGTVIWDGRFEIVSDAPGEVRAMKGLQNQLSLADRTTLASVPAAARSTLPAFLGNASLRPRVASMIARVHPLAGARLRSACGVITHETKIDTASRGAGAEASLCWPDTAPARADRPRSE